MKRIMISAMASSSGKTVVTCGLLRAFQKRGMDVRSLKCGPDYIDPMYHSRVLGIESRNIDLFLQGEDGVNGTLQRQACDLVITVGAMGFYDGLGGTDRASAWETAKVTGTPVILVVRPSGQSLTLAAQIRGMTSFREPSMICGVLLTDCRESLFRHLKEIIERESGIPVLGFLPKMKEAALPSRHLGLVTASEIRDLQSRFDTVAQALEAHADLDRILGMACDAELPKQAQRRKTPVCRIAVAKDEAFCFYYRDNLDLLEEAGAHIVFFSPVHDRELPEADGLYLGGGYPELYAQALSANVQMRESIRDAVRKGMPTVAECGGFLYLQKSLETEDGQVWEMAGVLDGEGKKTDRLQRFGYLTLTAQQDSLLLNQGEHVPAHEFHYWECTKNGEDLAASKANGRTWRCGYATKTLYAAFPHLHFAGQTPMAERFVQQSCRFAAGEIRV